MGVFYSEYAKRWCVGLKLPQKKDLEVFYFLTNKYKLGTSDYQVLINPENSKFEKDESLIITCPSKEAIGYIMGILENDLILDLDLDISKKYGIFKLRIKNIYKFDNIWFEKKISDGSIYFLGKKGNSKYKLRLKQDNKLYLKVNNNWTYEGRLDEGRLIK